MSSSILLPSGYFMPKVGFGTWQVDGKELEKALEIALECGYRHIDTASAYENEEAIGNVLSRWLRSGKIKREEIFITTKLPAAGNRPSSVSKWMDKSLELLQLDYVDLYLIHAPFSFKEGDSLHPFSDDGSILLDMNTDIVAVWKEMEKLVQSKKTRSIGISNFNKAQISKILSNCSIKPENLQIEMHVYMQQNDIREFAEKNGITVTAYSPLGSPGSIKLFECFGISKELPMLLEHPDVLIISKANNVTPAQVLLAFLLHKNVAVIPKSINLNHIVNNIKALEISLSNEEINQLEKLDQGEGGRIVDFSFFKGVKLHPEFPFKDESKK
ncbi:unnamed protein product [Nezara viridula]|uniref:NADP-dependent oxidoreductase domain-containing protein n=1 Tax=Nezara viridula TaxID=85310 RepID=A0A9P0EEC8_NEZVI|nr:unnamed protein product [Nezara viridula]